MARVCSREKMSTRQMWRAVQSDPVFLKVKSCVISSNSVFTIIVMQDLFKKDLYLTS